MPFPVLPSSVETGKVKLKIAPTPSSTHCCFSTVQKLQKRLTNNTIVTVETNVAAHFYGPLCILLEQC